MEIVAGILIVASIALPVIVAIAVAIWVGMVVYSSIVDLAPEPAPVEEDKVATPAVEGSVPAAA
jgi:hypothetical protein